MFFLVAGHYHITSNKAEKISRKVRKSKKRMRFCVVLWPTDFE